MEKTIKELISPIQFDDFPNYKLHLVPGFALATFDYTGLTMLLNNPLYSTSKEKKKTYLYRRQLRHVPSFFSRQGPPGLHLPILARELLDRGTLLADGAWWIQEICGSVNRRWGDGAIERWLTRKSKEKYGKRWANPRTKWRFLAGKINYKLWIVKYLYRNQI